VRGRKKEIEGEVEKKSRREKKGVNKGEKGDYEGELSLMIRL